MERFAFLESLLLRLLHEVPLRRIIDHRLDLRPEVLFIFRDVWQHLLKELYPLLYLFFESEFLIACESASDVVDDADEPFIADFFLRVFGCWR